jgi:hypothetical protein
MFQNYFEINGVKYYTGTVFVTNHMGKQVEATFVSYNTEKSRYVYKIDAKTWLIGKDSFWRNFVDITEKVDTTVRTPVVKRMKDFDINGMFIGWVWYIFLMAISVIFKDAIWLWILISCVFFSWRSKKIKEEGTYIEW